MFDRCVNSRGSSLLELLVAISLFSIVGISLIRSSTVSHNSLARSSRDSQLMQIALDTLESYYTIDPISLDNSDDMSDTISKDSLIFNRAVDITVNSDGSRTVTVNVSRARSAIPSSETISNTFALQGSS